MKRVLRAIGGGYVIGVLVLVAPTIAGAQASMILTPPQGTTPAAAPTATKTGPDHTALDVNLAGVAPKQDGAPAMAPLPVQVQPYGPPLPLPLCNQLVRYNCQK
jgi:hypothetical protein